MSNKVPWSPNFKELVKVLNKKTPSRPVLFEFILGNDMLKYFSGDDYNVENAEQETLTKIKAFMKAGYDHVPLLVKGMKFPRNTHDGDTKETISLNIGSAIKDRDSFDSYQWPTLSQCDFSLIERTGKHLDPNVRFMTYSYDGILENAIGVVGYEALCMLMYDDPNLFKAIFYKIGSIVKSYYLETLKFDKVGGLLLNDDWGFNAQTMFPPAILREHVFPWYKEITEAAHKLNKPVILHSCGYYGEIINDIINDIKVDGRHSYEDNIIPVEKAYQSLEQKLAVIGGIDVDFLVRATPQAIYNRAYHLLSSSKQKGAYALGSGNSVPDYVPIENYLAMRQAAIDFYLCYRNPSS
jgi:uroporphyrinogen decarboxylase